MNNNEEKVLKEIFSRPSYGFHIRELARITKLNPNTIVNITNDLEKKGIIKKESKKHIVEITLKLDKKEVLFEKRISNLRAFYNSDITGFLINEYSPTSITLMGSFSRGEDIESSDIDVVIFSKNKKIISLDEFEKKLNRKIHLIIAEKSGISKEFFNNLINGITTYGAISA